MSKEPNINEEKIAIEKAVRKDQRTIEDYVVNRLESLERIDRQQEALIESQLKEIQKYEKFIELLKKHTELKPSGYVSMIIFNSEDDAEEVIKMLGLKEGKGNE